MDLADVVLVTNLIVGRVKQEWNLPTSPNPTTTTTRSKSTIPSRFDAKD
jgi:hypothetical protein